MVTLHVIDDPIQYCYNCHDTTLYNIKFETLHGYVNIYTTLYNIKCEYTVV